MGVDRFIGGCARRIEKSFIGLFLELDHPFRPEGGHGGVLQFVDLMDVGAAVVHDIDRLVGETHGVKIEKHQVRRFGCADRRVGAVRRIAFRQRVPDKGGAELRDRHSRFLPGTDPLLHPERLQNIRFMSVRVDPVVVRVAVQSPILGHDADFVVICVEVVDQRNVQLAENGGAGDLMRLLPDRTQRRKKKRGQDRDDRYDHQEFHKRERCSPVPDFPEECLFHPLSS